MKSQNKEFLLLLRAGVTGVAESNIGDVDWKEVELLAAKQGVLPFVFDGYQRYFEQKSLQAPVEVKLKWYAATQQLEKHYHTHLQAIKTLCGYLAEKGFRTMILKGYSLSLCYPKPEYRPCGDIDIYQFGDWKKADELLEKKAHIEIDRSHHHHTVYKWNGVTVENHYDFINRYAHNTSAWMDDELKKIAGNSKEMVGDVVIPDPTLHAAFLIRHAGAHFSSTSINLRHVLDWYFFKKKYGEQVDWEFVKKCTDKVGMTEFHRCLDVCAKRLVEDDLDAGYDKMAERVWQDILHPEFNEKEPHGLRKYPFMWRRWWTNRWKHKLVFKENLVKQLFALIYTHGLNPEKMLED